MNRPKDIKRVILFVCIIFLFGCKPTLKVLNQPNVNREFASLKEYSEFVYSKYGFSQDNFFYFDSSSRDEFFSYVVHNNIDYFFGIFKNDSSELEKSRFIKDNESCLNRIEKEITNSGSIISNDFFKKTTFKNLLTGSRLDLSHNDYKKIVLIFSHRLGGIHKKEFVSIENLINNRPDCRLIILSLDNLYNLKP